MRYECGGMMIDFTYRSGSRPVELCQLAGTWDRKTVPHGGVMGELKVDGWRAPRFPGIDGQNRLWTRGGHEINGTGHILHRIALMEKVAGERLFIDGEFQVGGTLAATKAWCESGWKGGGEAGQLFAFDVMPLADWERGRCGVPLIDRKAWLVKLLAASYTLPDDWEWRAGRRGDEPATPISVIGDTWLETPADVLDEAGRVWAADGEGLVLKRAESVYVRARSNDWMKVKRHGHD
jgi:ATP-dependent DNA ligase